MYEAARVRHGELGQETADFPQKFAHFHEALKYVSGTSVSQDGNRPWIRDTTKPALAQFLVIGGNAVYSWEKERFYKTARIRMDIGFDHIAGMLPGEIVAVKYWHHVFDVTSRIYRPLFYIAKTQDFKRHIEEGTFATVFNAALEDFCL